MVIRYASIFALLLFLNGTAFANQPVDQKKLEMEELEKQMKSFRGKVSLYKKCLQGKCSEQERKVAAQEAWQDGKKLLGAIVVIGGIYTISRYWPKSFKQTLVDNQQKIFQAKSADEIFQILGWNIEAPESRIHELDEQGNELPGESAAYSLQGWTLVTPENKQEVSESIKQYGYQGGWLDRQMKGRRVLCKEFRSSNGADIRKLQGKIVIENNKTKNRFGGLAMTTNSDPAASRDAGLIKNRIIILRLPIDTYQGFKK